MCNNCLKPQCQGTYTTTACRGAMASLLHASMSHAVRLGAATSATALCTQHGSSKCGVGCQPYGALCCIHLHLPLPICCHIDPSCAVRAAMRSMCSQPPGEPSPPQPFCARLGVGYRMLFQLLSVHCTPAEGAAYSISPRADLIFLPYCRTLSGAGCCCHCIVRQHQVQPCSHTPG